MTDEELVWEIERIIAKYSDDICPVVKEIAVLIGKRAVSVRDLENSGL